MKFQDLSLEILSRIFVECQQPDLALLTRGLYEASQSVSSQADFLIKEFGKEEAFSRYGYQGLYPVLAKKESLALALIKRGAKPFSKSSIIVESSLKNGWTNVFNELLKMNKLSRIKRPSDPKDTIADPGHDPNHSTLFFLEPLLNINKIESWNLEYICKGNHVDILKALLHAHKIRIDVSSHYGIPKDSIIGKKSQMKIHKRFIFNVDKIRFVEAIVEHNRFEMMRCILQSEEKNQTVYKICFSSAMNSDKSDMVKLIAEYINISPLFSQETLELALYSGNLELAKMHPIKKVTQNHINDVFLNTVYGGNLEAVKFIVGHGADVKHNNCEALVHSLRNNYTKISKYLIEQGIKVSEIGKYVTNGFMTEDLDFIKFLVNNGADIHLNKDFALQCACHHSLENVKYLVELGSDIYASKSKPLKNAIHSNNVEIVKYILEKSTKPHPNLGFVFRRVCLKGKYEMAKAIIESKYVPLGDLTRIVSRAYKKGFYEIVTLIIKHIEIPKFETLVVPTKVNRVQTEEEENNYRKQMRKYKRSKEYSFKKRVVWILSSATKRNLTNIVNIWLERDIFIDANNKRVFVDGCGNGIKNLVEKMISGRNPVNAKLLNIGLAKSISSNQPEIYRLLLQNGADVKLNGNLALVQACKRGNLEIAKELIELGADVKVSSSLLLEMAIKSKRMDLIQLLLSKGVEFKGSNSVVIAAKTNQPDMLKLAIEHGADVNAKNSEALAISLISRFDNILKILLENGANGEKNKVEKSCEFLISCQKGDLERVKQLVSEGVDPKYRNNLGLLWATSNGHLEIVRFLLENGVSVKKSKGRELTIASRKGYYEIVKLLISCGADPESKKNRPLICASINDHIDIVKLFTVDHKVSPKLDRGIALYWTAKKGSARTFKEVFSEYKDSDDYSRFEYTGHYTSKAIVWAALGNTIRNARLLFLHGADFQNRYGTMAVNISKKAENEQFSKYLVQHGAWPDNPDENDNSDTMSLMSTTSSDEFSYGSGSESSDTKQRRRERMTRGFRGRLFDSDSGGSDNEGGGNFGGPGFGYPFQNNGFGQMGGRGHGMFGRQVPNFINPALLGLGFGLNPFMNILGANPNALNFQDDDIRNMNLNALGLGNQGEPNEDTLRATLEQLQTQFLNLIQPNIPQTQNIQISDSDSDSE
ncbi:hypothetical protein BB559_001474 [Furculomyces boomerangus]|uniref:Uncharacterized protein n=2 Tax=Harpellales TaxID=61421 RepID=A0A2T9Z1S0_9FUNG|nr:hypothetical protein BB559_001474 [Furculomyces boomerangus]PVZ98513.1 hypothetical protein BB558_005472 [Smittium angustum]